MTTFRINTPSRWSIGWLLIVVFGTGLLVASVLVYTMFVSYRMTAVSNMAKADGQRIASLAFEHLYSVMRKGSERAEIDELIQHVQRHLPGYRVAIIRGAPVVRQFGDRPGQDVLRRDDPVLAEVLRTGKDFSGQVGPNQRYVLAIRATGECLGCHADIQPGEVNGALDVNVPLVMLEAPITDLAYQIMYVVLALLFLLFLVIYLILRSWVSRPIQDLASVVSMLFKARDYAHKVQVGKVWPREVRVLAVNFNLLMRQVRESHLRLEESSRRDPLTGLFNRRHMDEAFDLAARDAAVNGRTFAILQIDLDGFKVINDQYGHAAGDALLLSVGKALQSAVRESEVVARMGGDEFAVLAFVENNRGAEQLALRLRQAIESCTLRLNEQIVQAACSVGSALSSEHGNRLADVLEAADLAMYRDKAARRQQP
jgi:c-di-GMP phosphodiesterase